MSTRQGPETTRRPVGRSWFGRAVIVPDGTRLLDDARHARQHANVAKRRAVHDDRAQSGGVPGRQDRRRDLAGQRLPGRRGPAGTCAWTSGPSSCGGRSSEFDALLNTVRLSDGTLLRIDDEGEVQDENRGNPTIRNGAIGVAVGAIIGALAGGGKGAAVGAVVGGAGGVILSRGHEQLDLPRGTDVMALDRRRVASPATRSSAAR